MWWQDFGDKGLDEPLKDIKLESGKGISGCEMQEICGWGINHHTYYRPSVGFLRQLKSLIFGSKFEG